MAYYAAGRCFSVYHGMSKLRQIAIESSPHLKLVRTLLVDLV